MIRPLALQETLTDKAPEEANDVDALRETLLAIGRIPMLTVEEEERLAHGISVANGKLRRSMLRDPAVVRQVAEVLDRVARGEERLDRALDVSLADLKNKPRLLSIVRANSSTLHGIVDLVDGKDALLSERQACKVQRLVDETLLRTKRIELLFKTSRLAESKRYRLARERYEGLRNRMVAANLRLAVSIAKKYKRPGVSILDLIQEGSEGLIRAAEKFKPALGFKFSTYSVWWIQQRIRAAASEKSRLIRIGDAAASRIRRLRAAAAEGLSDPNSNPSFEDLPLSGISRNRREELRRSYYVSRDILSLDSPLQENSQQTHADALPSHTEDLDGGLIRAEHQQAIGKAFRDLTARECQVLRLRFGLEDGTERNLAEIGRILEISRERVRQIEQVSLQKLRTRLNPEQLN